MNNVSHLPVPSTKPTLRTMTYNNCSEVLYDHDMSTFRPGQVNMKCAIGDTVLLVGKEKVRDAVIAVAMVGTITSAPRPDTGVMLGGVNDGENSTKSVIYDVEWSSKPVKIDSDFSVTQGGYIALEDREAVLVNMLLANS
jgi:hypothetical protein